MPTHDLAIGEHVIVLVFPRPDERDADARLRTRSLSRRQPRCAQHKVGVEPWLMLDMIPIKSIGGSWSRPKVPIVDEIFIDPNSRLQTPHPFQVNAAEVVSWQFGAGAAAGDAGDRASQQCIGRWVRDLCARIPPGLERRRLRRRRERRNRVSLGGGSIQSFASAGGRLGPP
jgi:hypothetical protein